MKALTKRSLALVQINEADADRQHDEPSAETLLWRSVLLQHLLDGTVPISVSLGKEASVDRDRAISWVMASVGVTCEDFEDVCHLALIDPDLFREHMKRMIDAGTRFILRQSSPKEALEIIDERRENVVASGNSTEYH